MKKLNFLLIFLTSMCFSRSAFGQYLAGQTFNALLRHYDPDDRWKEFRGEMHLYTLSKDWSSEEDLVLDKIADFYQSVRFDPGNTITKGVARNVPFYNIDNQPTLTEEDRGKYNLTDEAIFFMRHHHMTHFGLPMYLAELGVPMKNEVTREVFNGKECLVLEFGFPGNDPAPYFNAPFFIYVNPEKLSMEGIRYTGTGNALQNIYAVFNGEITVGGIIIPQVKTYYRSDDDSYLLSDAFYPFTTGEYGGLDSDKLVIRRVVDEETTYFYSRDYRKWAECWSHEPDAYFSVSSRTGYNIRRGWDEINENMRTYMMENPDPHSTPIERSNFIYYIQGDLAWVYYDNREGDAYGKQQRVLRKENGKWKIINMTTIDEGSYLEVGNPKRIIYLKFKPEVLPEQIEQVHQLFLGMPAKIEGMTSALWMESPDENSNFSHSIILEFTSEEALRAFEIHKDYRTFSIEGRPLLQHYSTDDFQAAN